MDECGLWSAAPGAGKALAARVDGLLDAWRATRRTVVAVSNEVGSGVVPGTASGVRYRDELGHAQHQGRRAMPAGLAVHRRDPPAAAVTGRAGPPRDRRPAAVRAAHPGLAGRAEPVHGDPRRGRR